MPPKEFVKGLPPKRPPTSFAAWKLTKAKPASELPVRVYMSYDSNGEGRRLRAETSPPTVLSIAGSDSGGGAGIQADLKTFAACGVFGCSAITALTAQNTRGVSGVYNIPSNFLRQQIDAVLDDLPVSIVKTGLLPDVEVDSDVSPLSQQFNLQRGKSCTA